MMKPENRGQRIRGVVAVDFHRSGMISFDPVEMEKRGNVIAYTPWHRHDDDLSVVEKQMKALADLYSSFDGYCGMVCGYEYKDYKK